MCLYEMLSSGCLCVQTVRGICECKGAVYLLMALQPDQSRSRLGLSVFPCTALTVHSGMRVRGNSLVLFSFNAASKFLGSLSCMRHVQAYERLQVWPRVVQRSVFDGELGTSVCSSLSCVFIELMYVIIAVLFSFLFSCMLRICTFVHVHCAQSLKCAAVQFYQFLLSRTL